MARPPSPPKGLTSITVEEAVGKFLEAVEIAHGRTGTLASKRVVMRAFRERLGDSRKVFTLTTGDFDDTLLWMIAGADEKEAAERAAQGRRPRTGRKAKTSQDAAKSTMRQFAEFCHRRHWLPLDVTLLTDIFVPKKDSIVEQAPMKKFALEEWRELLDLAESVHMRCRIAVALGFYSGRRVSEVVRMRWQDVDFDGLNTTYYNAKGGRTGSMPLYPDFLEEMKLWHDWVTQHYGPPQPHWWVVPNRASAEKIRGANSRMALRRDSRAYPLDMERKSSCESVNKDVRRMLAKLGIGPNQGTGTHTWRRSAATELRRRYNIRVAMFALGHKNEQTTRKYTGDEAEFEEAHAALMSGALHPPTALPPANVVDLSAWRKNAAS